MKKRKIGKIIKIVVAALVVVAIVGVVYSYNEGRKQIEALANLKLYQTMGVTRGDIERTVNAVGSVSSQEVTNIVMDWGGKAQQVNFEVGDMVNEGDVLALVVNEDLDSQVKAARNSLRQQEISLEKQKDSLTRSITAPISGRIKELKAVTGEDASTVGATFGQLCWISPDGMMTLNFKPAYEFKVGDTLEVRTENGVRYAAQISKVTAAGSDLDIFDDLYLQDGDYVTVHYRGEDSKLGDGYITIKNGKKVTGSGKINDVLVSDNQFVARGDDLFLLDTADAQLSFEAQNLSVSDARIKLADLAKDMDKSAVPSPMSGVVSAISLTEGALVTNGTTVATIQDVSKLQTTVLVDELDIPKVKVGQKAYVTIEALDDAVFEGVVSKISAIGTSNNSFASYPVTIEFDNPGQVMIGMSCEADIQVEFAGDVLMLPVDLLSRDAEGYYVNIITSGLNEDGTPMAQETQIPGAIMDFNAMMTTGVMSGSGPVTGIPAESVTTEVRRVEVGMINENFAQIVSGLEEGDVIAVDANNRRGGGFGAGMSGETVVMSDGGQTVVVTDGTSGGGL